MMKSSVFYDNDLNLTFLKSVLEGKGFAVIKHKKRQIEQGLATTSFRLSKGNNNVDIFVMKLNENNYVCAGYQEAKLLLQKSFKNPSQLSGIIEQIFAIVKPKNAQSYEIIEKQINKVRYIAQQKSKKFKDYSDLTLQMKSSDEYLQLVKMKINLCEQIQRDVEKLQKDNKGLHEKYQKFQTQNKKLNDKKHSLERTIYKYKDLGEVHLLQFEKVGKIKDILSELIKERRSGSEEEWNLSNILNFSQQIEMMAYLKESQIIVKNINF